MEEFQVREGFREGLCQNSARARGKFVCSALCHPLPDFADFARNFSLDVPDRFSTEGVTRVFCVKGFVGVIRVNPFKKTVQPYNTRA